MSQNFDAFVANAKSLSGLTPELESCLQEIAPRIVPQLVKVTDAFYVRLITLPITSIFLEKHGVSINALKETHTRWLNSLFTQAINDEFAQNMAKVGDVHAAIQLPLSFMAGAMSLINKELISIIVTEFGTDSSQCTKALQAVSAVTGFALIIMQQSYQLWE
ncbi:MAG: protoglobin domain-containing protein [Methylococcaceae bacterium]